MSPRTIFVIIILAALALGVYVLIDTGRAPGAPEPAPSAATGDYRSDELGIAFDFRTDSYEVKLHEDLAADPAWQSLVLLPKGFVPPAASEGPPSISIIKFANPNGTPLETWVKTDPHSNYQLLTGDTFATTTLAGEPAFSYQHSGLYETDAVAVAHGGNIYLFSAGWMTPNDRIRTDFQDVLKTVEFTN